MNKNLIIIPLLAAVLVLIFPFVIFSGNHIMVTTTTSMLPVLHPNDMIIVEPSSIEQKTETLVKSINQERPLPPPFLPLVLFSLTHRIKMNIFYSLRV